MKKNIWMIIVLFGTLENINAEENPFSLQESFQQIDKESQSFLMRLNAPLIHKSLGQEVTSEKSAVKKKIDMHIVDSNASKHDVVTAEKRVQTNETLDVETAESYKKTKAKAAKIALEKAIKAREDKIKQEAIRIEMAQEKLKQEAEAKKEQEHLDALKRKKKEEKIKEESKTKISEEEVYKKALNEAVKKKEKQLKAESEAKKIEEAKKKEAQEKLKLEEEKYKKFLKRASKVKQEDKKVEIEKADRIVDLNVTEEASKALKEADEAYLKAIKEVQ